MLRRIGQGCQEVAVPKRDVGVPVLEDPIGPSLELNEKRGRVDDGSTKQ